MSVIHEFTFVCHHGSPGTPDDFQYISQGLTQYNWHAVDRYSGDKGPSEGAHIQMGYSWGSVNAIKSAVLNPEHTKAVILISPYMFVEKKMSPAIKTILSLPIVGNILLSKMAPKSISKMILESSSPKEVPESYRPCEQLFSDPKILKPALFEKDIPTSRIINDLKALKKLAIPVLLLRGDSDKTSGDNMQFHELAKYLDYGEVIFAEGGHALPWTHTQGVIDEIKKFLSNFNQ
ncbi:MAG: alpha/beta hydrolase [Bacteriovoracaceae bacterium]|nr:alpha/beta hydrolase [Bacteriovoracaceae bacterium]